LKRFRDTLITTGSGDGEQPIYPHVMVIDGNDARGIDVGVLSKADYPVQRMRSHVDDGGFGRTIFSRDCPEYWFTIPEGTALAGEPLVVLVNHLKRKFGGQRPDQCEEAPAGRPGQVDLHRAAVPKRCATETVSRDTEWELVRVCFTRKSVSRYAGDGGFLLSRLVRRVAPRFLYRGQAAAVDDAQNGSLAL